MCSIFSLRKIILARSLHAWKKSAFFPSINYIPRYCFYDAAILLETFLYDDNFSHSWGDVSSLFFPEPWYKCDSAEHAPSNVVALNTTSTAWSSPVPCYYIPPFNFFLGGAKKPREYGECQMLQLDRYWSLGIWLNFSKGFTVDSSNTMSQFRLLALCFHLRYILQVPCLHHIVERRLQNIGVFVMLVKHPKYKGDVDSFVDTPCWFCNPLLHNGFRLVVY